MKWPYPNAVVPPLPLVVLMNNVPQIKLFRMHWLVQSSRPVNAFCIFNNSSCLIPLYFPVCNDQPYVGRHWLSTILQCRAMQSNSFWTRQDFCLATHTQLVSLLYVSQVFASYMFINTVEIFRTKGTPRKPCKKHFCSLHYS